MASITGLEYAFTKAPANMRSLVFGFYQFTSAISAALGQAFVALSEDPLLIWNYGSVAIIAFVAGCLFWITFRKLDKEEERLNVLPESTYTGKREEEPKTVDEEGAGSETPEGDRKTAKELSG
jgi:proton-dependent oligopeptide transporter, POT family